VTFIDNRTADNSLVLTQRMRNVQEGLCSAKGCSVYQWYSVSIIVGKKVKLSIGQNKWPVAIEFRRCSSLCYLVSFGLLIGESVKIWKEDVVTSAATILTSAGRD